MFFSSYESMKVALIDTIRTLIPFLQEQGVSFAALFGSQARGEAREDSDVDLLVKFASPKSLFDVVRLERMLTEQLHKKVDVVTEGALSPYMRDAVMRDLAVIYG